MLRQHCCDAAVLQILFHFRQNFPILRRFPDAEHYPENISVLPQTPRLFDLSCDIDTSVCHQKFRHLLLKSAAGAVDIQYRYDHRLRLRNSADKGHRLFQRITFDADKDDIRMPVIMFHIRCFHGIYRVISLFRRLHTKAVLLHGFQMRASCDQRHILPRFCHICSDTASGPSGSNDQIFHKMPPSPTSCRTGTAAPASCQDNRCDNEPHPPGPVPSGYSWAYARPALEAPDCPD